MTVRFAGIAAIAAAFAAAFGSPAAAASVTAQAKAKVLKPLVLQSLQDLDLGTLLLTPGNWSGATVKLSRTGQLTCSANVICSGVAQVARFNVAGSNAETVIITVPSGTLVNQNDASKTLTLVPDAPASILLTNSGAPGSNFEVGGTITLDSSTAAGTYVGTIQVTADYQ